MPLTRVGCKDILICYYDIYHSMTLSQYCTAREAKNFLHRERITNQKYEF